jgi:hypothetical protein
VREMRLIIAGLAGAIAACLIFSTLILSRSNLEEMLGYTSTRVDVPASPIDVRLTISGLTEPRGVGSKALLSISVISRIDAANVSLKISVSKAYEDWPSQGIELMSSLTSWKGDLTANVSVVFNSFATVNCTQIGYGRIFAEATWYDPSFSKCEVCSIDQLGIAVLGDEVLVIEDAYGNLPYMFPPGLIPTLPIFPVSPDLNATLPYP